MPAAAERGPAPVQPPSGRQPPFFAPPPHRSRRVLWSAALEATNNAATAAARHSPAVNQSPVADVGGLLSTFG